MGIAVDCSQRVCGAGRSWNVLPDSATTVPDSECHGRGICNRNTGVCSCRAGFVGASCEHTACPNDCSGHGVCLSMTTIAGREDAPPLSNASVASYGFDEVGLTTALLIFCNVTCATACAISLGTPLPEADTPLYVQTGLT